MLPSFSPVASTVASLRATAASSMESGAFGYYASGALDESTLHDNAAAFQRVKIVAKTEGGGRRDDSSSSPLDTNSSLLGTPTSFPLGIAPCAFHKLACEAGEVATSAAASASGVAVCWSTFGTTSIYQVVEEARRRKRAAAATPPPQWFQLYWLKDFELTKGLVSHAVAAGCSAVVLTVDRPALGKREVDRRAKFDLPKGMLCPNVLRAKDPIAASSSMSPKQEGSEVAGSGFAGSFYLTAEVEDRLLWSDLTRLKAILPAGVAVVVKGILTYEDGFEAVLHGCDAVWVSNHGGRQLDNVASGLDALPEVLAGVRAAEKQLLLLDNTTLLLPSGRQRTEVYVDGGVSSGEDVFKAVALGADHVFLSRAVLWALAAGREEGVRTLLTTFRAQFEDAMRLAGCEKVADISLDMLREA